MNDHDESLIDKVKNALGMGGDGEHEREHEEPIQTERPAETAEPPAEGATQASGWEGASGGMGASGAMGGAGAAGPVGTTPPSDETDHPGGADPGRVRTEYEMGHELDPDHETRAESGALGGSADDEGPHREPR